MCKYAPFTPDCSHSVCLCARIHLGSTGIVVMGMPGGNLSVPLDRAPAPISFFFLLTNSYVDACTQRPACEHTAALLGGWLPIVVQGFRDVNSGAAAEQVVFALGDSLYFSNRTNFVEQANEYNDTVTSSIKTKHLFKHTTGSSLQNGTWHFYTTQPAVRPHRTLRRTARMVTCTWPIP